MPDHLPAPDIDDDALAEALADQLVELARRPGVLRLAALRMAGLIHDDSPDHHVAKALGLPAYAPAAIRRKALDRLRLRHPELQNHLNHQP